MTNLMNTDPESTAAPATRFDAHTALESLGDGRCAGRLHESWWIVHGPNGGYIAAIVLRAAAMAVADPTRMPRTLTIHYLSRPEKGPFEIAATIERSGRSLTSVSLRMLQNAKVVATALAAFSKPFAGVAFQHRTPPQKSALAPGSSPFRELTPPMHEHYDYEWLIGDGMFAGADRAVTGGLVSLTEARATDALLVAAYSDCWPPAIFTFLSSDSPPTRGVPTVELTLHFRTTLPIETMAAGDPCLVVFRTETAAEGFIEETGEIWSPDGATLLAESRQLALQV